MLGMALRGVPVEPQSPGDLRPDPLERIEGAERVLGYEPDPGASAKRRSVGVAGHDRLALEDDPPSGDLAASPEESGDGKGERRLAATGFAEEPHHLSPTDLQVYPPEDLPFGGPNPKSFDAKERPVYPVALLIHASFQSNGA